MSGDIYLNGITYPSDRVVAFPGKDGKEVYFKLPEAPEKVLNRVSTNPPETRAVFEADEEIRQMISSPFNFKGTVETVADLPASGNAVNDTYYVIAAVCRYSWTGSEWKQSSMNESAYTDELNLLEKSAQYNLLPFPFAQSDWSYNGRFVTRFLADGRIEITGTGNSTAYYEAPIVPYSAGLILPAGSYCLSGGTGIARLRLRHRTPGDAEQQVTVDTPAEGSAVITLTEAREVSVSVRCMRNTEMPEGGVVMAPMLTRGSTVKPWVSPSLSADYLRDRNPGLHYVNLVRYPYVSNAFALGDLTGTVNTDGSVTVDGVASRAGNSNLYINDNEHYFIVPDGTYVLSGASDNVALVLHYKGDGDSEWSSYILTGTGSMQVCFDTRKRARVSLRVAEGTTVSRETVYPMLEKGSEPHAFVPPGLSAESLSRRLREIERTGLCYRGQATDLLAQSVRTIQQYDDAAEQYLDVDITSYWMDELTETGIYNLRTVESRSIYDLPAEAQGVPSLLTVTKLSDRSFQRLEANTGSWFRYVFPDAGVIRKWYPLGGTDSFDSLPDHWAEYLPAKIRAVQQAQAASGLTGDSFLFFTDYHHKYNAKRSPAVMARIMEACGIGKVFFGGDLINHFAAGSTAEVIAEISDALDTIPLKDSLYAVDGNHEHHKQNEPQYDPGHAVDYSLLAKRHEARIGWVDAYGSYWVDNAAQRLRYFLVSCEASAAVSPEAGASAAAELDRVPEGYTVVLITHFAVDRDSAIPDSEGLVTVLDKLQALASGGDIKVACVLSGHIHRDRANTGAYSFPVIATTTDAYGKSGEIEMTAGTVTEQAFEAVILDTASRTVRLIRIGAGESREFSY